MLKVHYLLFFILFVTFINYFLLLRMARGIILLYLFIVQGEGVRLYIWFFKFLLLLREKRGTNKCFFFSLLHLTCGRRGRGLIFFSKPFFHCLGFRVESAHLNANQLVQTIFGINLMMYNAIQFVTKCPPTINKKHQYLCTQGKLA